MQIDKKWALVTGGSTGIGKEVALQLAAAGANVVIVARNREPAEAVIAHYPERIFFLRADLSCPDDQDRLVNEIKQRFPELAILVNNAGIQVNMPAVAMGDAGLMTAFRGEISVNLMAPIALSFGLMPLLANQDEAVIVNVSSGLGIAPKRTAPVYCASKAGLQTLSRALRYRCEDAAPTIRVMDVVMALVDTAMTSERGGQKMSGQAAAQAIVNGIKKKRDEVWVGKTRLLRIINRLSPALAHRLLRNA